MTEAVARLDADQPLWRRIVDFPLVAMVLGIGVILVTLAVAMLLVNYVLPPIGGLSKGTMFDLIGAPLLVVAYKLVIRHLGEVKRDDLRTEGSLRSLGLGLLAGALLFAIVAAIAAGAGVYTIDGEGDLSGLAAALIGPTIFAAISEEMLFRGVLFRWLEAFGGSWAALLVTSALFGGSHLLNPHASGIAALGIALEAGLMLGAAYMLTRSLWLPMGIHAAWNFTQGEIFDVPVSGTDAHGLVHAQLSGSPLLNGNGFGLEASPIAMVVAGLFGVWLLILAIRKGELMAPWWVRRRRSQEAVGIDVDADPDLRAPVESA